MKTDLPSLLATPGVVIADGSMGVLLFSLGLDRGDAPERWNLDHPAIVQDVHRRYIEAGAQIILTNTLGGTRIRLGAYDLADRTADVNRIAAEIASAEADAAGHPVVVGGSIGSTGQLLAPLGDLSFEDAVAAFEEQARALVAGGVTALWIETMSDLEEVRAAVQGARAAAPDVPIVATMTFDTHGRTMMGVKPEQALNTVNGFGVLALGANCGNGPDEIETAIEKMHAADPSVTLVAKANAGLPRLRAGTAVYDATPADMAAHAARVRNLGARIIGACCGSTPDHIRAMVTALAD
ncbi:MAG: homocysteine S-methyltransferase family protein [Anaerolineae bacterium]|nr:homocysteine S-methyltransferase family protein [Anaerolineae bacterium]